MNIEAIDREIAELEDAEMTVENVSDLASLYIIKEHLQKQRLSVNSLHSNVFLPYFNAYLEDKRRYQRKEISEDKILEDIQYTCSELNEFLCNLYNCTDLRKERKELEKLFEHLHSTFCKIS